MDPVLRRDRYSGVMGVEADAAHWRRGRDCGDGRAPRPARVASGVYERLGFVDRSLASALRRESAGERRARRKLWSAIRAAVVDGDAALLARTHAAAR